MKLRAISAAMIAIAVAATFAFAPAAPASAAPGDGKVTGRVVDSVSGAPVANVCVVNGPVALRCWSSTNANGDYEIIIPGLTGVNFATNIQFLRTGYTTQSQNVTLTGDQTVTLNISLVSLTPGVAAPSAPPPAVIGNPPPGAPAPVVPAPTAAPVVSVEQRIADFWKRIDALAPTDNVSSGDLGGWALNVIERQPRARLTAANFRTSTAAMQAGFDRAGLSTAPLVAPTAGIEQKIADFWTRIDALAATDFVSAADLGQWALNVIGRNSRAQLCVTDVRASTSMMQAGFDSAGLAP